MSIFNMDNYIIKNSTGEILKFYLDKNNRINYNIYNSNFMLIDQFLFSDDIVSDFSLDIDNKDRVHLIYTTKEGTLYYSLYSNSKWAKKTLTKFDTRSNSYSNLKMKINKGNVHILYSFSNLINPNVWTIQHLIGHKGDWEKINVISFTSGKHTPTFSFDFDKFDNIHMIYNSVTENIGNIYYTFFNNAARIWNHVPKLLSEHQNNSSNPHLLVDKIDNIHALWIINKNNSFELKYKHLNQIGSSKNIWKEEVLPLSIQEHIYPIIYEEKDCLKIYITNKKRILSLVSNDYGSSWNIDDTISIPSEIKIQNAKYLTNFPVEKNTQKTFQVLYYFNDNQILLKQDLLDYIYRYSSLNSDVNNSVPSETSNSIDTSEKIDVDSYTQITKEEEFEQIKKYFDDLISRSALVDALSNISNNIKNIENINKNFASHFKDMDNTILALKESIDVNNQCLIEMQEKFEELNSKTLRKGFFSRFFKRD